MFLTRWTLRGTRRFRRRYLRCWKCIGDAVSFGHDWAGLHDREWRPNDDCDRHADWPRHGHDDNYNWNRTDRSGQTIQGTFPLCGRLELPHKNAAMLYVNGDITSLTGPGEYSTAINNGQAVTVTATATLTVTGDIRHASEPVTTGRQNVNGTIVPTADTLIRRTIRAKCWEFLQRPATSR